MQYKILAENDGNNAPEVFILTPESVHFKG